MANDRIWIVCKKCGNGHLWLKYYPSNSYVWESSEHNKNPEWGAQHIKECWGWYETNLNGAPGFELQLDGHYRGGSHG